MNHQESIILLPVLIQQFSYLQPLLGPDVTAVLVEHNLAAAAAETAEDGMVSADMLLQCHLHREGINFLAIGDYSLDHVLLLSYLNTIWQQQQQAQC